MAQPKFSLTTPLNGDLRSSNVEYRIVGCGWKCASFVFANWPLQEGDDWPGFGGTAFKGARRSRLEKLAAIVQS